MTYTMRLLYVLISFTYLITASTTRADERIYTVAVAPQFASIQVYRDWTPLLNKLEEQTGYHFKLLAYNDFSRFERDLWQGVPDLVYLNPYHMVIAKQKNKYRPLVRDSSPLSGILVVRKDSPIKSVKDLEGKTVAFPSPNALGASLYIRALFAEKYHIKINPVYVGNHQNVYRHVLLGEASAGGGVKQTLSKESENITSQLDVLYKTPDIFPHPLAAHPRVPKEVSKKIVSSLLSLSTDQVNNKLLTAIQMPQLMEADYKHDYADLAQLKLDRYAEKQTQ